MALREGLPAKKAATDADDTRYDFRNDVACNNDGSPRGGVTSPVGVSLVSSSATMNTVVAAFNAVAVRDGGIVKLANDGATNVLHAAAPASNSRIDVVYAKQNDSSSTVTTPDVNDLPVLAVAQGTAAASPTKPSIPVGAVELATVQIPAGATATNSGGVIITQTAQFTAAPGAFVPVRTLALLTAWTNASVGQRASVFADGTAANNADYFWNGTAWRIWNTRDRIAWTPVINNFTTGGGSTSVTGFYEIHNGVVSGEIKINLAALWNITGNPSIIPPVAPAVIADGLQRGMGTMLRSGVGYYIAGLLSDGSGNLRWVSPGGSGTFWGAVTRTAPATWDNGDIFSFQFSYPI